MYANKFATSAVYCSICSGKLPALRTSTAHSSPRIPLRVQSGVFLCLFIILFRGNMNKFFSCTAIWILFCSILFDISCNIACPDIIHHLHQIFIFCKILKYKRILCRKQCFSVEYVAYHFCTYVRIHFCRS